MNIFFIILLTIFGIIIFALIYRFIIPKIQKKTIFKSKLEFPKEDIQKKEELKSLRERFNEKSINKGNLTKKTDLKFSLILKNYNDIKNNIEDSELKKIIEKIYSIDNEYIEKMIIERIFNSNNEFEDYIKDNIILILNEKYNNLKYKISEFTKTGKDVKEIRIKLMKFPLKIKILKSNFNMNEFEKILNILDHIKKELE